MYRRKAFTLIELLVVIAIIAILAAILFPVFAQAREKARQAACLSNCKQINLALMMYGEDYDGYYPVSWNGKLAWPNSYYWNNPDIVVWWNAAQPYIKNTDIWACLSGNFRSTSEGVQPVPGKGINLGMSYAMAWGDTLGGSSDADLRRWATPPSLCPWPAEAVVFGDCRQGVGWAEQMAFANMYPYFWDQLAPPIGYGTVQWADGKLARHSGRTNLGFVDGHVKSYPWQIVQAYERPAPIGRKCIQWKMWWPRYPLTGDGFGSDRGSDPPSDCQQ